MMAMETEDDPTDQRILLLRSARALKRAEVLLKLLAYLSRKEPRRKRIVDKEIEANNQLAETLTSTARRHYKKSA